jgi:APA family basic amino acid/polyamine antiporter
MNSIFRKKDLSLLIADANDPQLKEGGHALKRSLTSFHLVMLGIGGIIGAGIFVLTGSAAANYAGPAIVYSFMISGLLCAFAGLCYAEMAAMVPVAGSAYTYSYATMGELIAWIIGWDLILEYAFGAVTVSIGWSGYFISLLRKTFGLEFSDLALRFTIGPWEKIALADGTLVHGIWNFPASLIALGVSYILYKGIKEAAWVNNIIVMIKVTIVVCFILLGWGVVSTQNWIANPNLTGLLALIPEPSKIFRNGTEIMSFGFPGVMTAAGVIFFSYIGFDAVSTTAQEARNPQRDLPIGILGSLLICTILYVLMALTLTGVVNYKELGVSDPIALGIDRISVLRGWNEVTQKIFSFTVKLGAIAGLSSVILVLMLGQTRVFYAMAKDGLLPWFDRVHPKFQTPHIATLVTGLFVAFCGGLMPISIVGELVSIGTLLAFVLVCIGVIILRIKRPDLERPFKTPIYWLVAPLGVVSCLWVMYSLPADTWVRLFVWLFIGFAVYFMYGINNSRLRKK